MKTNSYVINHIKEYSTFQWLLYIKKLESFSEMEFVKYEIDKEKRFHLQNSNWYKIIIDLSIRFANKDKVNIPLNTLPNKNDYLKFISLYISSKDNESTFSDDLKASLHVSLSRYAHEQLKKYTPIINDLGRLIDLYREKELLFKQFFGLTPTQMFYFIFIHHRASNILKPFDFKVMYSLLKGYDSKLKAKKLELFFSEFSISIKLYRKKCKELGFSKDTIKNERLIDQFPILDLGQERYFIPSFNSLVDALTYKIFHTLCEKQSNIQGFKRSFGDTFENYTRRITKFIHNDFFYECDNLITNKKEERAEYYLLKNDTAIVIESKLLPISENMILNGNIKELEDEFISTIDKALSQIKSCFNKLNVSNKYGIIVIHAHTLMLENYIYLFNKRLKYDFLENILILSIIDFEILMGWEFPKIIDYFEQFSNSIDKPQIPLFFEMRNKYLLNVYDSTYDELEKDLIKRTEVNVLNE